MANLEPSTEALRDALGAFRDDNDLPVLLPVIWAYADAARRRGVLLPELMTSFRELFDEAHPESPADVGRDRRQALLTNLAATAYVTSSAHLRRD